MECLVSALCSMTCIEPAVCCRVRLGLPPGRLLGLASMFGYPLLLLCFELYVYLYLPCSASMCVCGGCAASVMSSSVCGCRRCLSQSTTSTRAQWRT